MTPSALPGRALLAALALALVAGAARAEDGNPFVPPSQREAQIQQRVDKAVGDLEGRLVQSLVNSLEGKGAAGAKEAPLAEALKKLSAAPAAAPPPPQSSFAAGQPGGGLLQSAAERIGFPALPPLPGAAPVRESPVPAGSVFIGCLDRKAFFQDHSGSPFLVDPSLFPAGAGPGACGR